MSKRPKNKDFLKNETKEERKERREREEKIIMEEMREGLKELTNFNKDK